MMLSHISRWRLAWWRVARLTLCPLDKHVVWLDDMGGASCPRCDQHWHPWWEAKPERKAELEIERLQAEEEDRQRASRNRREFFGRN